MRAWYLPFLGLIGVSGWPQLAVLQPEAVTVVSVVVDVSPAVDALPPPLNAPATASTTTTRIRAALPSAISSRLCREERSLFGRGTFRRRRGAETPCDVEAARCSPGRRG